MKKQLFLIGAIVLLLSSILTSCGGNSNSNTDSGFVEVPLKYARLFRVFKSHDVTRIDLINPWDTAVLLKRYYLVPKDAASTNVPVDGEVIDVPLKRMACAFATEICYAEQLGLLDAIVGVSEKQYITNKYMLSRIEKGFVSEIGPAMAVNLEQLIKISPDIFFVSPFKDNKYGPVEASGVPLGIVSAYLETHPLGRAEWVKFMALFFGKEQEANKNFSEIEVRYKALVAKAKEATLLPTVFASKPYQGIWYVSPGNSYMAQLFADAGARYLYADRKSQGPIPFDFETVYKQAVHADFWVVLENYQGVYSYQTMKDEYASYADFDAFKARKVVFCNTNNTAYYDEGLLRPDVLLSDLLKAFHPELMEGYNPVYFDILKQEKP
ncbi:ABC transporter substrate-binding protein [Williamwhitmania taraxaci]|uniref:Iron complex transport system substrate-binding protein n=1 Tax=Williamwhitmania taraxaci TaxID=1640674 RepID=A0A1G6RKQ2_9BACT|nr:ABC transporter substrate-binding protein [Williamwhitmania taraxaci]SDD04973.1 iron complex transport system substrate-binding protein [Williamwhitmania taraxaci]